MLGSSLINMPPDPGVWTLSFQRPLETPGRYSLELRDATGTVYSGSHYMRFESPAKATGYLVGWTDLEESDELVEQVARGETVETQGHSDVWLPVVYALYHSAGPVGSYHASAFWADGGHQSQRLPYDQEQELPEGCDLLLTAHESNLRGVLISPEETIADRIIVWSGYSWDQSISEIYHPVVELEFESGEREKLVLLRGPYRRNVDKAILMPAPEGEYRIEWEEISDFTTK